MYALCVSGCVCFIQYNKPDFRQHELCEGNTMSLSQANIKFKRLTAREGGEFEIRTKAIVMLGEQHDFHRMFYNGTAKLLFRPSGLSHGEVTQRSQSKRNLRLTETTLDIYHHFDSVPTSLGVSEM